MKRVFRKRSKRRITLDLRVIGLCDPSVVGSLCIVILGHLEGECRIFAAIFRCNEFWLCRGLTPDLVTGMCVNMIPKIR